MANKTSVNRQIRSFAFVWSGITLIIGVAAFLAIYLAYGETLGDTSNGDSISIPIMATNAPVAMATAVPTIQAALPTNTSEPETNTPGPQPVEISSTPVPNALAQQAAEVPTNTDIPTATFTPIPPTATLLPVNDDGFHVAIQVQTPPDFNMDLQKAWFRDVNTIGLKWYKQQVRWIEHESEKGVYDWTKLDTALPSASEAGIQVLVSIIAAPDWSRDPNIDHSSEGPPVNMQDFADFLTAMLERYPDQIHAIEVWNEPNLDREWMTAGGVSAAHYMEMLRLANQTIKNIDPGIIVISAAPSPTGGIPPVNGVEVAVDDFVYLDSLIANGLLDHADCIGVHHNGYNIGPSIPWDDVTNDPTAEFRGPFDNPHHSWSFYSTLQTYANKIATAGGQQKLCITEFGWASVDDLNGYPAGFEFAKDNTLEEQAEWTVEALNNMQEWGFVWIASIWNYNYSVHAGFDPSNDNTPYSFIGPEKHRPVSDAVTNWVKENQE